MMTRIYYLHETGNRGMAIHTYNRYNKITDQGLLYIGSLRDIVENLVLGEYLHCH